MHFVFSRVPAYDFAIEDGVNVEKAVCSRAEICRK